MSRCFNYSDTIITKRNYLNVNVRYFLCFLNVQKKKNNVEPKKKKNTLRHKLSSFLGCVNILNGHGDNIRSILVF